MKHPARDRSSRNSSDHTVILIVASHGGMRAALYDWLTTTFPACHFLEAKSGEEALAVSVTQPADIVLMDINLPQMNGIETTQRIKEISPQAQVVLMSFHEDYPYRAHAEMAGASAFVPQRTIPIELIPILARLLRQPVDGDEQK